MLVEESCKLQLLRVWKILFIVIAIKTIMLQKTLLMREVS